MPVSSCCQEDGDACGPFIDQEREIEALRKVIVGCNIALARDENIGAAVRMIAEVRKRYEF